MNVPSSRPSGNTGTEMSSQSNSPATPHNDSMEHSTTDSDRSHGLTGGASASTLSSLPSILDPPIGFEHLESSNHAFDTGVASPNICLPITSPARRRTRLDPCVSPGMVEALHERLSRSFRRSQPVRASNLKSSLLSKTSKTTYRKPRAKSGRFMQRRVKLSDREVTPGETQLSNKQHVADDGPRADQMTPKGSKPKRRIKQTIGIPAESPIVTERLRPTKPQAILEAKSPIARQSEEEWYGEESEGTVIGSTDDEDEYEEELEHGEKANSNESIDVKDRDIQVIDLADMPVGVSGGANTARFINKRKLCEYENDIEDVRPDPSIPYTPPGPKKTANGEIIDLRISTGLSN
ncbi:hypothetical protein RUND412_007310 [Rhizina undulata]